MEDLRQRYRERAAHCTRIAQYVRPEDKAILLEMAEAWQRIADRAPTIVQIVEASRTISGDLGMSGNLNQPERK